MADGVVKTKAHVPLDVHYGAQESTASEGGMNFELEDGEGADNAKRWEWDKRLGGQGSARGVV